MAKIKLDYAPISTNGLNSLDKAISYLNSVINSLGQNSIPKDFNYYNVLVNTISDLIKQRDRLVYFKNWLINSNKNYNSLILMFELQAVKLPTSRIKSRSSIVR